MCSTASVFENELKKTEDEARTQALQDSIFLLYDQRMELFPSTSKSPTTGAESSPTKRPITTAYSKRTARL